MDGSNLLFIFTDQQRYDTLRVYGNDTISMPNLNRLAEKSAVFQHAYVTQPVCTPSRASILTGLYPHQHQCIENNKPLGETALAFPEIIENSPYVSAYIGKWHLGDEVVCQHGFDEWISTEDNYRQYYSDPSYLDLYSEYHHFLVQNGFKPDKEVGNYAYFSREFCTRIPESYSKPAFIAQETIRFITENRNKPFIAYLSFLEPHPPYYSAYDDMYDKDKVCLPPLFDCDVPDTAPLKYKYSRMYYERVGRHFPMKDEATWRKLIARYWGALTLVDKSVGNILDSLEKLGLSDNTVIVFTSDHGEMMGDYRMLQKYVMCESAVRVPLLLRVPGITDNQIVVKEPVSQIDLVPTLLDVMRLKPKRITSGASLYPKLKGEESFNNRDVVIEWNGDEGEDLWFKGYRNGPLQELIGKVYGAAVRTLVTTDGWKLSITEAGENELYNLKEDPGELCNLYYDTLYDEQVQALGKKLRQWQIDTGDNIKLAF